MCSCAEKLPWHCPAKLSYESLFLSHPLSDGNKIKKATEIKSVRQQLILTALHSLINLLLWTLSDTCFNWV